jgi:hypothetical protein
VPLERLVVAFVSYLALWEIGKPPHRRSTVNAEESLRRGAFADGLKCCDVAACASAGAAEDVLKAGAPSFLALESPSQWCAFWRAEISFWRPGSPWKALAVGITFFSGASGTHYAGKAIWKTSPAGLQRLTAQSLLQDFWEAEILDSGYVQRGTCTSRHTCNTVVRVGRQQPLGTPAKGHLCRQTCFCATTSFCAFGGSLWLTSELLRPGLPPGLGWG